MLRRRSADPSLIRSLVLGGLARSPVQAARPRASRVAPLARVLRLLLRGALAAAVVAPVAATPPGPVAVLVALSAVAHSAAKTDPSACVFTLRDYGLPQPGTGNRCGTSNGASGDTSSPMCSGAFADGRIEMFSETEIRARCAADSSCVGYAKYTAPTFLYLTGEKSLERYDSLCLASGGRLASVLSEAENAVATSLCPAGKACFIGMKWNVVDDAWQWIDGKDYDSPGCCEASKTSYQDFASGQPVDGDTAPCVAIVAGEWRGTACPDLAGYAITYADGTFDIAAICRIDSYYRPVTTISGVTATAAWETYEIVNVDSCSNYPIGVVERLDDAPANHTILPLGHTLSFHLAAGGVVTGQDRGAYDVFPNVVKLSAGAEISTVSIGLPIGSVFNVGFSHSARLRFVMPYITNQMASAGACKDESIAKIGADKVDEPASSPGAFPLADSSGSGTIHTVSWASVTFRKGGRFKVCFSDDGSFDGGHSEVLGVMLDVSGVTEGLDPCVGDNCLAQRSETCYARLGESGLPGACSLPVQLGGSGAPGQISWTQAFRQQYDGRGYAFPTDRRGTWALMHANMGCNRDLLKTLRVGPTTKYECAKLAGAEFECGEQFELRSTSCKCIWDGMVCNLEENTSDSDLYEFLTNSLSKICPVEPQAGFFAPEPTLFSAGGAALGSLAAATRASGSTVAELPTTEAILLRGVAATVAICYCSNVGIAGCTEFSGFQQQIGVLYIFVAHPTYPSAPACTSSAAGVLAPLEFVLCVRCPPDGCKYGKVGSRVRFAKTPDVSVEAPSWSTDHACSTASMSEWLAPAGVDSTGADGGQRADYKRFAPQAPARGFSLPSWPQYYAPGTDLDVCLCLDACNLSSSWFKAGQLDIVHPVMAVATTMPRRPGTELPTYVGASGQLALYASTISYGSPTEVLGLSLGGGARLADFDPAEGETALEVCAKTVYTAADGSPRPVKARDVYVASLVGGRLRFDNATMGQEVNFTILETSTPVICYCAQLNPVNIANCLDPPWFPIGAMAVGGPSANHFWLMPTLRLVRFEYQGRELRSTDRLRFVTIDYLGVGAACSTAPPIEEVCFVAGADRHRNCARAGTQRFGDYATKTMAHDSINCDAMNRNCEESYVDTVEATDGQLRVRFTAPPTNPSGFAQLDLSDSDTLLLEGGSAGIVCDSASCTPEVVASALGQTYAGGLRAYYDFNDAINIVSGTVVEQMLADGIEFNKIYVTDRIDFGLGPALLLATGRQSGWRLGASGESCNEACDRILFGHCDSASLRVQNTVGFDALAAVKGVAGLLLPKTYGGPISAFNFFGLGYAGYSPEVIPDQTNATFPMYWQKQRLDCATCKYEYLFANTAATSTCEASVPLESPGCQSPYDCRRLCFCSQVFTGAEFNYFSHVPGRYGTSAGAVRIGSAGYPDTAAVRIGHTLDASRPWSVLFWTRVSRATASWRTLFGFTHGPYSSRKLEDTEVEVGIAGSPDGALFLRQAGPSRATPNDIVGAEVPEMAAAAASYGSNAFNKTHWTHVGVVYTGGGGGGLFFYVNGKLSYRRVGVKLKATLSPLHFGGGAGRSWAFTAEYIEFDEVRYYSVPLEAADVLSVMNSNDPGGDKGLLASAAVGVRVERGSDAQTFEIPRVASDWGSRMKFKVNGNPGGRWRRMNRGVTSAEIMVSKEQKVKVCWERDGRFLDAGIIQFKAATPLENVGVYLTARTYLQVAPFIMSFETAPYLSDAGSRYRQASGSMRLQLTFLNRNNLDVFRSNWDDLPLSPPAGSQGTFEGANQIVCGMIFREMWSDDDTFGFPLPKGCYYQDIASGMREFNIVFGKRNPLRWSTKYQIVMNGMSSSDISVTEEIVMLQVADEYESRRYDAVQMGHAYLDRLGALKGSRNDPQFRDPGGIYVVGGDPDTNLQFMSTDDPVNNVQIHFMGPDWQTGKIKRGNHLGLWFHPLTAWSFPVGCLDAADPLVRADTLRIKCAVAKGLFRNCGELAVCSSEAVVKADRKQHIMMTFGEDMSDLWGEMVFKIDITGIVPRVEGIPPGRIAAEVYDADMIRGRYMLVEGPYLWAPTIPTSTTLGRLLTDSKDSVPFEGAPTHLVYVKIILAMQLRGRDFLAFEPFKRADAGFQLKVPEGFQCLEVSAPPVDLGEELASADGDMTAALANYTHSAPTGFGTPDCTYSGTCLLDPGRGWSLGGRWCNYTLLQRAIIPEGSSMVFGVRVKPRNASLTVSAPNNLWSIHVEQAGDSNNTTIDYGFNFYRTGQGGVPVVGYAGSENLVQPIDLSIGGLNVLRIFLQIRLPVPAEGCIDVEAPSAFDFGSTCAAFNLEDAYYVSGPLLQLRMLPTILSCTGARTNLGDMEQSIRPRNVARVCSRGDLVAGERYGFSVAVRNPVAENRTHFGGGVWSLRTRESLGANIEASSAEVPAYGGAGQQLGQWQIRNGSLMASTISELVSDAAQAGSAALQLSSTFPSASAGEATSATLLFRLPWKISGAMVRVIAPVGFLWQPKNVRSRIVVEDGQNVSRPFAVVLGNVNFTAGFPAMPMPTGLGTNLSLDNYLVFEDASYIGGVLYGFSMPIIVPEFAPVFSAQSFYVDVSPTDHEATLGLVGVLTSPAVRRIVDAEVTLSSQLPASPLDLLIRVRLTTPVHHPGRLQIGVPANFTLVMRCELRPWPGQAAWQSVETVGDALCVWDNMTRNIIVAPTQGKPLPGGLMHFRVAATTPAQKSQAPIGPCGTSICWHFATFDEGGNISALLQDPRPPFNASVPNATAPTPPAILNLTLGIPLDAPLSVASLDVTEKMFEASLLEFLPAERNDRPGRVSRLVFRFRLKGPKQTAIAETAIGGALPRLPFGLLQLTGPAGFAFPTACGGTFVSVRRGEIFGPDYLKWQVDEWEAAATIRRCDGRGRIATLQIEGGMRYDGIYAVSLTVTNPLSAPVENYWTLSFHDHFSVSFPSFPLWTFSELRIEPMSPHAGMSCNTDSCQGIVLGVSVPVAMDFRVRNVINTGGEVRITVPPEFGYAPIVDDRLATADLPAACTIWQYRGGNLTSPYEEFRESDAACFVVFAEVIQLSSQRPVRRSLRVVLKHLYSPVEANRLPRAFTPESIYRVTALVDPPPGLRPQEAWLYESRAADGTVKDIGDVLGYEVKKVLLKFEHSNKEYNWLTSQAQKVHMAGLTPVPDLAFEFVLSDIAGRADTLVLIAPKGFSLADGSGSCIFMAFLEPPSLANNPDVLAPGICKAEVFTLPLSGLLTSLQSGATVRLQLKLTNAEEPAPPGTNYWILRHLSEVGALVAASMTDSWPIIPTIASLYPEITGDLRAAGVLTTVIFSFHNIQKASEIEIMALQPDGFDFDACFVRGVLDGTSHEYFQIIHEVDPKKELIRVVASVKPRTHNTLELLNVRLPLVANSTRWRMSTYELSVAVGDYGTPYLRDEVIFDGFFVPGRVTITDVTAATWVETLSGLQVFSMAVLGRARSNITLYLNISTEVAAGDVVLIELQGAGLDGILLESPHVEIPPASPGSPPAFAVLKEGLDTRRALAFTYGSDVAMNQQAAFTFPVLTPPNRATLALEMILIEIYRGGYSSLNLIATNDAARVVLPVVTILPNEPAPTVEHAAPLVTIEVAFVFDPLDTNGQFFELTAPRGFTFPSNCLSPGEVNLNLSSNARCISLPVETDARSKARLDCLADGGAEGVECLAQEQVVILTETPDSTPAELDNIWFVESIVLAADASKLQLGRAELSGFPLVNMECQATYASLASVPVDVGVSFMSRVPLPAGGSVRIEAPSDLQSFGCSSEVRGFFSSLSIGEARSCVDNGGKWSVTLSLNQSLSPGLLSLSLPALTPLGLPSPESNLFNVFLQGTQGENLDVALRVPGQPIVYGLRANAWPVRWRLGKTKSEPVLITLPIEVIDKADIVIDAIFVSLPQQPYMRIVSAGSVRVFTAYGSSTRITKTIVSKSGNSVMFELSGEKPLDADVYSIQFLVDYPEVQSSFNIWRVALCSRKKLLAEASANANASVAGTGQAGCHLAGLDKSTWGSDVFSVFALAGFLPIFSTDASAPPPLVGSASSLRQAPTLWRAARFLVLGVLVACLAAKPPS